MQSIRFNVSFYYGPHGSQVCLEIQCDDESNIQNTDLMCSRSNFDCWVFIFHKDEGLNIYSRSLHVFSSQGSECLMVCNARIFFSHYPILSNISSASCCGTIPQNHLQLKQYQYYDGVLSSVGEHLTRRAA